MFQILTGPRPASTDPRPSQPGLSPSGQVCGQIGSAFGLTGCLIPLLLLRTHLWCQNFLMLWHGCCMHHTGESLHYLFGQKSFGSLWQWHNRMHSWWFFRILPTDTVKIVDKSQINKKLLWNMFFNEKLHFECQFAHASWLEVDLHRSERKNILTAVHDGPWFPRIHRD